MRAFVVGLCILLVLVSCAPGGPVSPPASGDGAAQAGGAPPKTTGTGFYWPTGTDANLDQYPAGAWLSDGCTEAGLYLDGWIHVGWDIGAALGTEVYAISAGRVKEVHTSAGSWGSTGSAPNQAVIAEHYLSDGTLFYAVYGHVQTSLQKGALLEAGKPFATIGDYGNADHLHFGVSPLAIDLSHLGRLECAEYKDRVLTGDTDGYVDPVAWINTGFPGPLPEPAAASPTPAATATWPAPTPTSTPAAWIAFLGADENIWLVHPDGTGLTQFTFDGKPGPTAWVPVISYHDLKWSPDGTMLGAVRISPEGTRIQAMPLARQQVIPLVVNMQGSFDWLPDSRSIIYSDVPYEERAARGNRPGGLSILDLGTLESRVFIAGDPSLRLTAPDWSNGGAVSFAIAPAPAPEGIWGDLLGIAGSEGGRYVEVTNTPECDWSPDGSQLACRQGLAEIICSRVVLFSAAGQKLNEFPPGSGCQQVLRPAWSPDGRWLAYAANPTGDLEIYRSAPTGQETANLTNHPAEDRGPVWSPDASQIAFLSTRDGSPDIYVMNSDGTQVRRITRTAGAEQYLAWQPSGGENGLATPQPAATPEAAEVDVDPRDLESIARAIAYTLKTGQVSPFEKIITQDTLGYGTGMAGGREQIQKEAFLKDLADRLGSGPVCAGYDISDSGDLLIVWTKGWQPLWNFQGSPMSSELTFTVFLSGDGNTLVTAYFTPSASILEIPSVRHKPCPDVSGP